MKKVYKQKSRFQILIPFFSLRVMIRLGRVALVLAVAARVLREEQCHTPTQ